MMVIELTPGPNMGWLSSIAAQHGRRVGLIAVAGVTLGLAVQVLAAATGVSTLVSGFPGCLWPYSMGRYHFYAVVSMASL